MCVCVCVSYCNFCVLLHYSIIYNMLASDLLITFLAIHHSDIHYKHLEHTPSGPATHTLCLYPSAAAGGYCYSFLQQLGFLSPPLHTTHSALSQTLFKSAQHSIVFDHLHHFIYTKQSPFLKFRKRFRLQKRNSSAINNRRFVLIIHNVNNTRLSTRDNSDA